MRHGLCWHPDGEEAEVLTPSLSDGIWGPAAESSKDKKESGMEKLADPPIPHHPRRATPYWVLGEAAEE